MFSQKCILPSGEGRQERGNEHSRSEKKFKCFREVPNKRQHNIKQMPTEGTEVIMEVVTEDNSFQQGTQMFKTAKQQPNWLRSYFRYSMWAKNSSVEGFPS